MRKVLGIVFAVAVLKFVALPMLPTPGSYCHVELVNSDSYWAQAPEQESTPPDSAVPTSCEKALAAPHVKAGEDRYVNFGGNVYWLVGHRNDSRITLSKVKAKVAIERLRPFLGGAYASDGNVLLYRRRLVPTLNPPVDPAKLRRLFGHGSRARLYVTDGRWVLYEDQPVVGADARNFKPIALPAGTENTEGPFGMDKTQVYYGADTIPAADPATFRLIYLPEDTEVSRWSGFYAIDRSHLWFTYLGIMQPVRSDDVAARHEYLSQYTPASGVSWKIPRSFILPGCVLVLAGIAFFICKMQRRVRARYKISVFSPYVGMFGAAFVVLPNVFYALMFTRCTSPESTTVYLFLGGALVFSAALLGLPLCQTTCRVIQSV